MEVGFLLVVHRRDFENSFKKHYETYNKVDTNMSVYSKRLILFYCVECGLKCELLKHWKIEDPADIIKNQEHPKNRKLCTHNLSVIINELKMGSTFKFPVFKTNHQETIDIRTYHEFYRYGVKIKDEKDRKKEDTFEEELKKVAEWLAGKV